MITKEYHKVYIQDVIISRLEMFTKGDSLQNEIPWCEMTMSVNTCVSKGSLYMHELHERMKPYYEMYFFADPDLCKTDYPFSRHFVEEVAGKDSDFHLWAAQQDIIAATEGWGDFLKRKNDSDAHDYLRMMQLCVNDRYYQDWATLADKLQKALFQSEVYSDYKTDELLCILHAVAMIMQQDWVETKKKEMFNLLANHWNFMKYFYSVMTRHIIGCRLSNFTAVTNAVMQSNENAPYLEIYYCALCERMDTFGLKSKAYEKLDIQRQRLFDRIKRTKQSDILYELCDVLFPEEFQQLLHDHRPKSYDEVEEECSKKDETIRQLQNQTKQLEKKMSEVTALFSQMLESSISIEEIEAELQKLPSGMAWEMLNRLNEDLSWNPTWRGFYPKLSEMCLQRLHEEINQKKQLVDDMRLVANRPTYSYTNTYESGSTHNDNRRELKIEHLGIDASQLKTIGK